MNNINFDIANINLINKSEAWEIKDAFFNNILATNREYKDIKEALEYLSKDFPATSVLIKVGSLDKNGNIATNSKTFSFVLPRVEEQENNNIIYLQPINKTTQQYNLNGITPQNNTNEIEKSIFELEKRIKQEFEAKILKMQTELEWSYRQKELERREKDIKEKEKELLNKVQEYEEKLNKIIPPAKDILFGLVSKAINGIGQNNENQEKQKIKPLSSIKYKLEENEDKKAKAIKILDELNKEELEEVINEYLEEEENFQEEYKNEDIEK